MHAYTFYIYLSAGGVEVLKLQFAYVAAVHRVGPVTAELLHIKVMGTHADLLVGVEGDADVAVLHFRVVSQPAHRLDNLCDARLVISTQERVAVSHDEVFAHVQQQLGELLGRHDDLLSFATLSFAPR